MFAIKFFLVMVGMFLVDMAWTYYMKYVAADRAYLAGFWSSVLILLSAFVTVNYVHDYRLVVAAVIGAFFGTVVAMKWKKDSGKA
jgi:hypothetical protein